PAVAEGFTWLVIIAVLASAISAYYYLRVLFVFFMRSPEEEPSAAKSSKMLLPVPRASAAVLVFCAVALLVLGVVPGLLDVTAAFFATLPAPEMTSFP